MPLRVGDSWKRRRTWSLMPKFTQFEIQTYSRVVHSMLGFNLKSYIFMCFFLDFEGYTVPQCPFSKLKREDGSILWIFSSFLLYTLIQTLLGLIHWTWQRAPLLSCKRGRENFNFQRSHICPSWWCPPWTATQSLNSSFVCLLWASFLFHSFVNL